MIDIYDYFEKQRRLDKTIMDKFGTKPLEIIRKQVFAFMVELGEFANETRYFKHWSTKPASPKEILLDEYVDALHFLLSFSYMIMDEVKPEDRNWLIWKDMIEAIPEYFASIYEEGVTSKEDLVLYMITRCFQVTSHMIMGEDVKHYDMIQTLWFVFFLIGFTMDFTMCEIFEAYDKKHEINYARQEANY